MEVRKGDQEGFMQEAAFELVSGRWALGGKDIPLRGNHTKIMIIFIFKPKHGHGARRPWVQTSLAIS